jgi:hypothetical protein
VKLFGILTLTAGLIASCSSSDNPTPTVTCNKFSRRHKRGWSNSRRNKTYKLTGKIQVNSGATLTIPAGTTIEGTGEHLLHRTAQGGKLNVNGTAAKPVIMTSGFNYKSRRWLGWIICGKAPINRITGGTGTAQSEVADLS